MKVGDLVYDAAFGAAAMIIATNPTWIDDDGFVNQWDFEVISDGIRYYADADELLPTCEDAGD